ncbi:hypothetical protein D3C75_964210 [compost metagenome]
MVELGDGNGGFRYPSQPALADHSQSGRMEGRQMILLRHLNPRPPQRQLLVNLMESCQIGGRRCLQQRRNPQLGKFRQNLRCGPFARRYHNKIRAALG